VNKVGLCLILWFFKETLSITISLRLLPNGYRGSILEVNQLEREANHSSPSKPGLRVRGAIPKLRHTSKCRGA
jgi:hypothetical protein